MGEHFLGNIVVEFFTLLLNVTQEGIAGPATNHHDKENWATPKEHCHGCSRTDGLSDCRDCISQCVCDLLGGDVVNAVVFPDGGDWGVVVGTKVGLDSANDDGGCSDWAQCHITQCHMGCCVVLLIFILYFEGDVDAVGIFEGGIVVVYEPSVFEESKVLEAKDSGSSCVLLLDFDVLARTHDKEIGKNGEL